MDNILVKKAVYKWKQQFKMEKYEQISVVGEGSYGLVMKCRHRETDQLVAVKKFLETEDDATIRKMALREIRMLKRLKHENLVTMIEVFRYRRRFYLVFEYLEGTVLDELEKAQGGLGEEKSRDRIFQVARAISYCHNTHIIHRDVKPENVLVSSLGVVKLCDFGFARHVSTNNEPCTEYVATRWYRAPELLVSEPNYGSPVDIWAIGCLFAEMITGDPIFPGDSDIDQLYLIVKMLGKPCLRHQQLMMKNSQLKGMIKSPSGENTLYKSFSTWSLQAIDFLSGCIKMDPNHRLTSEEILKHSFFTHDRFPQRFLPALREKVNLEFNNPLLRKYKTEIIMSTDKKDEVRPRKTSISNEQRWRFTLHEGSMKRKYSYDIPHDDKMISLTKSSQRLNLTTQNQKNVSSNTKSSVKEKTSKGTNMLEMQMLEKSLESLAKFSTNKEDRPLSETERKNTSLSPLLRNSPQQFQSLHYNFQNDLQKSPNILQPSINNISFNTSNNNKDFMKKSVNQQQKPTYLKKLERNIVLENYSTNTTTSDESPMWLNSFSTNLRRRKESKSKIDDFVLPTLPGASGSPHKPKKKSLPEIDLPHSNQITPRIHSSSSPAKTINSLF